MKTQRPKRYEDNEQQALIEWAAFSEGQWPELALLYHVPNEGKRSRAQGGKQKAMGLRPGVPDLCLPVARAGYHGLYIEMKVEKNRPTVNQRWWLDQLAKQGYLTVVCYSFEEAQKELVDYLKGVVA